MANGRLVFDESEGESEDGGSDVVDITAAKNISASMEVNFFDISKKDDKAMKTVKDILKDGIFLDDIHILVVGKTGQGKSALVNSIIERDGEEIAKEGASADCCTMNTWSYIYPDIRPGIKVIVTDSPGLQDTKERNQVYIQKIKNKAQEVSLVLYCIKMSDHRMHNDDMVVIKELHQAFGPKFWERVIFVFTFANKEDCSMKDERDESGPEPPYHDKEAWKELIKKRFIRRVELRASSLKKFLKKIIYIEGIAAFVPAGTCKPSFNFPDPMRLPDRENWLSDLLKLCYNQIKNKHRFTKLRLNNKFHLAVIFDNRLVKIEGNESKDLSSQADALKDALKNLGFFVIHFNGLSSQSILSFLQSFTNSIDPSQLSLFALVFLSKGKTPQLYDCNNEVVPFQNVFRFFDTTPTSSSSSLLNVPKFFFFDLATTKDKAMDSFALPQYPDNTILLAVVHKSISASVIEKIADNLSLASVQKCVKNTYEEIMENDNEVKCIMYDGIGSKFFIDKSITKDDQFLLKQLEVLRKLWYPIRYQTIEELTNSKDELISIVRHERIAKIATSSASIALGGSLVVAGIALAPFTFGASIGLSVAGGVVGGLASLGGISAFIASKVTENKRLKKAQEHISLDQQLSLQINNIAQEIISAEPSSTGEIAGEAAAGGAMGVADISRFGAGVAIGLESAFEGGAFALRTTGRFAGMALAGVSLAVTVPIDIGFIAYHSYRIHQSSKDKTGKTDRNKAIKWLISQIEEMIKGTCIIIDIDQYPIEDEFDIVFDKLECGYKITVPHVVFAGETPSITVSTIFTGPFTFPEGYTLVSAVYDVVMPDMMPKPFTIELEHCINVSDESVASKMCFVVATINLEKKEFEFTQVNGGIFNPGDTYGSISQDESCYLCILYNHSGPSQHTSMKYAAHCCYERQNRNYWKINVIFTKYLSAHFKYAKVQGNAYIQHYPFMFKQESPDAEILLKTDCSTSEVNGWIIAHTADKIYNTIKKEEIDEPKKEAWEINSGVFPSFSFYAHVVDSDARELSHSIEFEGTDLELMINCQKEADDD